MLTTLGINTIKNFMAEKVDHARYKIGVTYYDTPITSVSVNSDGYLIVRVTAEFPDMSGIVHISEMQLCDASGGVLEAMPVTIMILAESEGLYYEFKYSITTS